MDGELDGEHRESKRRHDGEDQDFDVDVAVVCAVGAATFLGQLIHAEPNRDDAEATDRATEALLQMLGVPANEAGAICRSPLPELQTAGLRGAVDEVTTNGDAVR